LPVAVTCFASSIVLIIMHSLLFLY